MNFIVKNRSISCQPQLVIGDNKDYLAEFEFDSEWTSTKTARFETANGHVDVILQEDKCTIPVEVLKKGVLKVGVFDSTKTTTCCEVVVRGSIKEQDGDVIPPTEDVYAQLTEALDGKQEALVSGQNIKTVNGTSLLGAGNIEIEGGGAEIDDTTASTTKTYSSEKIEDLCDDINERIEPTIVDEMLLKGYVESWSSNGLPNTDEKGHRTDFIPIDGFDRLHYRTITNKYGYRVTFYDKDKNLLKDISLKGVTSGADFYDEVIDLTDSKYSNVKYLMVGGYSNQFVNNFFAELYSANAIDITLTRPLLGKKVLTIGDSITEGVDLWRGEFFKLTGAQEVASYSKYGAFLANQNDTVLDGNPSVGGNQNTICNHVQQILNDAGTLEIPDIIIISAETNDDPTKGIDNDIESKFTDPTEAYIDVDILDLTTFAGAMRWQTEKLLELFPDAKIFYATNIQTASGVKSLNGTKNKRKLMIEIANRLSVRVIDAFAKSGIYGAFEVKNADGKYLKDGLHPNTEGGKVLGRCYAIEVINQYM